MVFSFSQSIEGIVFLGLTGDPASRVVARKMEFRHVTSTTFEKNFLGLGKVLVTNGSDALPNLPSIVAVPSSGMSADSNQHFKGTRAGKCYNVAPSYTGRYYLRCIITDKKSRKILLT